MTKTGNNGTTSIDKLSRNYYAIHHYLCRHFPKTGRCEKCGVTRKKTQYSHIHGREYSHNREDYRELCIHCHLVYDGAQPPHLTGEAHPRAKLTADIVRECRKRYAAGGVSIYALAREFHVSDVSMGFALKGRTWKHIPMEMAS